MTGAPVVRAAGGVVWRRHSGVMEVVLVHRPRYDDWSLPKGKAEAGEEDLDCARREVAEETGLICAAGPELATARYVDGRQRPKVVRYWAMNPIAGSQGDLATDEVDEVAWFTVAAARQRLTYPRDRAVLESFAAVAVELSEGRDGPDRLLP